MEFKLLIDHPEFIPTVAEWYKDAWGGRFFPYDTDEIITRIEGDLNRDRVPLHIIATEDDDIIATTMLKWREMDIYPDNDYWLGNVYVSPHKRGGNVASRICEYSLKKAKELDIKTLYLQTRKSDDGGLYARIGWKPINRVFHEGAQVLVMRYDF